MFRGPIRRGLARARRQRRRALRRVRRRLMLGSFVFLALGRAAARYKLHWRDVEKVEQATDKRAEDLTETELLAAMKQLGIQKLELTPEDETALEEAEIEEANGADADE